MTLPDSTEAVADAVAHRHANCDYECCVHNDPEEPWDLAVTAIAADRKFLADNGIDLKELAAKAALYDEMRASVGELHKQGIPWASPTPDFLDRWLQELRDRQGVATTNE